MAEYIRGKLNRDKWYRSTRKYFYPRTILTIEYANGNYVFGAYGGSGRPVYSGANIFVNLLFSNGSVVQDVMVNFYINADGKIVLRNRM